MPQKNKKSAGKVKINYDALARLEENYETGEHSRPERQDIQVITISEDDGYRSRAARRQREEQRKAQKKNRRQAVALLVVFLLMVGGLITFFVPNSPSNTWLMETTEALGNVASIISGDLTLGTPAEAEPEPTLASVDPNLFNNPSGQSSEAAEPAPAPDTPQEEAPPAEEEAPSPEASSFTLQEVSAVESTLPETLSLSYNLYKNGSKVDSISRNSGVFFEGAGSYTDIPGVLTFRGDHQRQGNAYGTADVQSKRLEKLWSFSIGGIDDWTGVGWNGQPALVQWPEELRLAMNIDEEKQAKEGLVEGIYGTLDGKIYFFDIEDGEATRAAINLGFPIKGSVSVDPRGIPLLYSGQGISKNNGKRGKIGYHVYNLLNQEEIFFIDGGDDNRYREHGAFDSVGLVNAASDTLLIPGENGIFYTAELNTQYDAEAGELTVDPTVHSFRYKSAISKVVGTENSIVTYGNYGYFVDNSGMLLCINLDTLEPVWVQNVTDDTDATMALEIEENGSVALYTACEVDLQGSGGTCYIRRINALTGEIDWEYEQSCIYNADSNGGALSSPLVGQNELSDYVFFHISRISGGGGKLLAFNKTTGSVAWSKSFKNYGWSSPVGIYDEEGKGYILQGDSHGNLRLIDGLNGEVLDTIELGANIEGSPAVFNNIAVVGTRGQKIYGIKIV